MLAVTPLRPISRAIDFISAITPARAAPTIDSPDSPTRDESPTIAMIRPSPPFSRCGIAAWHRWIAPSRLTSIWLRHSSGVVSLNGLRMARPALLTRMLSPPKSATTPRSCLAPRRGRRCRPDRPSPCRLACEFRDNDGLGLVGRTAVVDARRSRLLRRATARSARPDVAGAAGDQSDAILELHFHGCAFHAAGGSAFDTVRHHRAQPYHVSAALHSL